ncbi:heme-degrading monooxygenase HmoA [Streptomyces sp. V1I1]|nr:heme-degrading monooxygenase HmoA [Streptomyces sp. V1I1]
MVSVKAEQAQVRTHADSAVGALRHRRHREGRRHSPGFAGFGRVRPKPPEEAACVSFFATIYATHKTEAIKKWLLAHPRFQLHFTPTTSSWLNMVERWFAELTNKKLRRSD